ncbi:MAG: 30S ribosomal protein S6 [Candidatus Adiutrix sp.]|jgi:small subunit ribosomal protein S6|nr:30S ribosomal protein S6 [Candidatus Adiutrix sp.]
MHPRRYETLILLAPNQDSLETFKNKVEGLLAAGGGQIVRFEDWGRRRLAYPVQKETYGHYLLYDYQGGPALAAELERNLKIDEKVFKYLTLVLAKKFTAEDLAAAQEKLLAEAARRESEKARREEAGSDDGGEDEAETEAEAADDEE